MGACFWRPRHIYNFACDDALVEGLIWVDFLDSGSAWGIDGTAHRYQTESLLFL